MSDKTKNREMYMRMLNANLDCEILMSSDGGKAVVYNGCLAHFLYDAVDEFMTTLPKKISKEVRDLAFEGEIKPWKIGKYLTSNFFDEDGKPC